MKQPESIRARPRQGPAIAAIATLAIGAIAATLTLLKGDIEHTPLVGKDRAPERAPAQGVGNMLALPVAGPSSDGRSGEVPPAASPVLIRCRVQATGLALAGVQLFSDVTSLAGPGDAEGILEVPAEIATTPRADPLTLWVEGWAPVVVRAEALPEEVLFDVVRTSIELRFVNGTADHRILRSLLQPHTPWPPADGPWAPTFEQHGLDVYRAEGALPGTYDLFLWVVYPDGEPRPFSHRSLEIVAGETAKVSFDLAAPRDPDEFESDS